MSKLIQVECPICRSKHHLPHKDLHGRAVEMLSRYPAEGKFGGVPLENFTADDLQRMVNYVTLNAQDVGEELRRDLCDDSGDW